MDFTFSNTVKYNREKKGSAGIAGAGEIAVASPKELGGPGGAANPEEIFVASVNSCIMLAFEFFAARAEIDFSSYRSEAHGTVEKDKGGMRFTKMTVNAALTVPDGQDAEAINRAAAAAEKYCLVSRSLNFPVEYELAVLQES